MWRFGKLFPALGFLGLGSLGCTSWDSATDEEVAPPPALGLHVVGNQIQNGHGEPLVLRGVNRSGTEYQCAKPGGLFFDGPGDEASVAVMASSWNVNAVRVPLNESCWLAINGAPVETSGAAYQEVIIDYVALLERYGLIPILELHWTGPEETLADRLQPLPGEHAVQFWTEVASVFGSNPNVVFEPFNEPYPGGNADTNAAWECWLNGCDGVAWGTRRNDDPALRERTYRGVGMRALVSAIRGTGARNLILLGGVQYSNSLTRWLEYLPADPLNNLAAAWHVYNTNPCADEGCWDGYPAEVAARVPLVVTEFGEDDCDSAFVLPLFEWFDAHAAGYLAWSWTAYGECRPVGTTQGFPNPWSLITSYESGTPNGGFAQAYHDHLEAHR
jgi:hypothetical protein